MKIAFFTETGYEGKFPRNNPNMRTDAAWICALNATHHPISVIHNIPSNSYDWGIVIIPKKKDRLVQYPLVENMKRVCSKVAVMQESTYWYWQDDKIESQVWYHSVLQSMDLIFCHNDLDVNYYSGITDVRCELLPSLMITDYIKVFDGERDGVMLGGNWASIYRGFDSYMISKILSTKVTSPTTGRMKEEERLLDINHLPWVHWKDWIYELSKHKYGIQLGTPAAGTFNLNCSYLGIPCIGYNNLNTQKILHPNLSVDDGDVSSARKLAEKLKVDPQFYLENSILTQQLYKENYSEEQFLIKIKKVLGYEEV
jgi:hypothetical protein